MGIRLPWRRLEGTISPFGPLIAVLAADVAIFHPAMYWFLSAGFLGPNEPQVRLNLALAAVLSAACAAWSLVRALGRASPISGTALAIAGYAVTARTWLEFLVLYLGPTLESADPEVDPLQTAVRVARVFGLVAFAWGLGCASGDVAAGLRRRPRT